MADPNDDSAGIVPPIQPTGSGVADLEIAREQDALADGEPLPEDESAPG